MANAKAPSGSTGSYQAHHVVPSTNHDWLVANHQRHLDKLKAEGKFYPRRGI